MKIALLEPQTEAMWRDFVAGIENALFYSSLEFRDVLSRVLGAQAHYFMAMEGERVRGVLPCFSTTDPRLGSVLNSLPYYGSNGGCLSDGEPSVVRGLIRAFLELERDLRCVASTLVSSPFEANLDLYEELLNADMRDGRIGQVTNLPDAGPSLEDRLFSLYDETARRNVRKARKSGVTWRINNGAATLAFLYGTHDQNIRSIGGVPKERKFFDCLEATVPERFRRLYVAERDGEPIAALLVFRFNRTVEYYTPAIVEKHRSLQPLALLVHEAMCEAAIDGYRFWNWGGTWASQIGVYRFKKKWGALEKPYHYYTRLTERHLLRCGRAELTQAFPNFYVLPFDRLNPVELLVTDTR